MKGVRIAVFHFAPLESFPPVQNLIVALSDRMKAGDRLIVYTTSPATNMDAFRVEHAGVSIRRMGRFSFGQHGLLRYLTYLRFYLGSMLGCLFRRPGKLVYYETISSFAPVMYKRWFRPSSGLFVHYHEYMTPEEYQGMLLNRVLLKREKKVYPKASWISHTNGDRLRFFQRDTGYTGSNLHVLPNYPPARWKVKEREGEHDSVLRLVYVGSFGSLDTIYIREIVEWVSSRRGKVTLDVYSANITEGIRDWMAEQERTGVTIKAPVGYDSLPEILPRYDAGLILYKGAVDNFIYNAPNKLFEYLRCGLDVWYPAEMTGIHPYDRADSKPRVIRIDYKDVRQLNDAEAGVDARLPRTDQRYIFEEVAAPLLDAILKD